MAKLAKYNLAFKGLAEGKHEFDFQIEKKFFEYFAGGITDDGDLNVKIILEKQSALLVLRFNIKGTVQIQCDRCLDLFELPVKSKNEIFVKFGEENFDDGDDIVWISPGEYQLNVAKLIYDFIILSIPIKHVHPDKSKGESNCNPEMLKRINDLTISEPIKPETDSRWNELKKLLDNE